MAKIITNPAHTSRIRRKAARGPGQTRKFQPLTDLGQMRAMLAVRPDKSVYSARILTDDVMWSPYLASTALP